MGFTFLAKSAREHKTTPNLEFQIQGAWWDDYGVGEGGSIMDDLLRNMLEMVIPPGIRRSTYKIFI